jgi:HD-like signal output (HDOD) protein
MAIVAAARFARRVRTQAGQVVNADLAAVLAEATKFSKKLTLADLEPKPDIK